MNIYTTNALDELSIKYAPHLVSAAVFSKLVNDIKMLLNDELKACHDIALAIDSNRGNEKAIAKFILERQLEIK